MAKKPATQDWHKEDIKAALRKGGTNMNELARQHGYRNFSAIRQALQHPYPKVERIIAAAIGVPPETIWPSRYQGKYSRDSNAHKVNLAKAA
jgi:Ner family transcriptional regulator